MAMIPTRAPRPFNGLWPVTRVDSAPLGFFVWYRRARENHWSRLAAFAGAWQHGRR